MRKWIMVGACVSLASTGAFAQHTIAEKHPVAPFGSVSNYRYSFETNTGSKPISLDETRTILEDVVDSRNLNQSVEKVVVDALYASRKLRPEDVAVTLLHINPSWNRAPRLGSFNGNQPQLASGLIRPFVAVAYEKHVQDRHSGVRMAASNDIFVPLDTRNTNKLIDHITGTQSGGDLSKAALNAFSKRRDYINNIMSQIGYTNFNVNQKLITGVPSGRDRQLLGRKTPQNFENSNRLTSTQVATMLYLIDQEAVVSRAASQRIKRLLSQPDFQAREEVLSAIATELPTGSYYMGTNAYTSTHYHDAAVFSLPNGERYALAIMTRYDGDPTPFIKLVTRLIVGRVMDSTGDTLNIKLQQGSRSKSSNNK
jgi:hypothetical protein